MKNISNLFKIGLFALLTISLFAACKKDATNPVPVEGDFSLDNGVQQIVSRGNEGDGLCFEVGFPITVALPDGGQETADNMEALDAIYNEWFEEHPTDSTCPAIVYPINVTVEDGTTHSVASEEDLIALLADCIDIDLGWEDCFVIQYPLALVYPDGNVVSYDNEGDMYNAMQAWSEANPDAVDFPTFDYPITVVKADGSALTIEDETALNALFEDCFGTWEPEEPVFECFEYVFPMTVAMPDGTTVSAASYEALDAIFMEWFENHPNDTTGNFPTIAYPINLQLESGEIVTVNNDEEFSAIFEGCYGTGGGEPGTGIEDCLTFNYPLTLVFPDDNTVAANNDDELWRAVFEWIENNPDDEVGPSFQYPISVTMTEDGSVVTVTSDDQLNALVEGCYDCVINDGEGLVLGGSQAVAAKVAVRQHTKIQHQVKQKTARMMARQAHSSTRF